MPSTAWCLSTMMLGSSGREPDQQRTTRHVSVDDNTLTLFSQESGSPNPDTPAQAILTVTIAENGTYTVVMTDAFDQPVDTNQVLLPVMVRVTDNDGDSSESQITLTLIDGQDPSGGETATAINVEPDPAPDPDGNSNASGYPSTLSTQWVITAGADRLLPESVTLDPANSMP